MNSQEQKICGAFSKSFYHLAIVFQIKSAVILDVLRALYSFKTWHDIFKLKHGIKLIGI
jgi:hypothetical protein